MLPRYLVRSPLALLLLSPLLLPQGDPKTPPLPVEREAKGDTTPAPSRVLLVSGAPSWEFRYLKNVLLRDAAVDVSCWLQSADPDFEQPGNTKLDKLPHSPAALAQFDAIVLCDPDPTRIAPEFVAGVLKAHAQGVGVAWSFGAKFGKKCLEAKSPLKDLVARLPVEVDGKLLAKQLDLGKYYTRESNWVVTPAGEKSPVPKLVEETEANRALWLRLPGFFWAAPVSVREGGKVIVASVHPAPKKRRPLVAVSERGKTRTLFLATDETYRWRSVAPRQYQRFWLNALRWLGGAAASAPRRTKSEDRRDRR